MGGISIWQLLIILLVVIIVFGSKRLRSLGSDLGSAIRGFKKEMGDAKNVSHDETESTEENETKRD